jgi:hypothetical protein
VLTVPAALHQALDWARFGAVRGDQPFAGHPPVSQRY